MAKGLNAKQQRFYVYELIDPRDGEVFYVGKGSGNRHSARPFGQWLVRARRTADDIAMYWRVKRELIRMASVPSEQGPINAV